MPPADKRKALAERAAEIYNSQNVTYSAAVDMALTEQNPTDDPTMAERLLFSLLNVEEIPIHPKRRSPRAGENDRRDMGKDTGATPSDGTQVGPNEPDDPTHA